MHNQASISRNLLFLLLQAVFFLLLLAPESYASDPEQPSTREHIESAPQLSDTLQPETPMNRRLDDPNYDTRFERGVLHPWHDTKSVYPRRTIPQSSLAWVRKYPAALA